MCLLVLEKWEDGYGVGCDPRREDSLYYYMKDDEWDLAIGFEVDPLYEERRSDDVTIQVVCDHRDREESMDEVARRTMYCRVIASLVRRYSHWCHLTVCSKHFEEIMADGTLADELLALGFGSDGGGVGSGPMWARNVPPRGGGWPRLQPLFAGPVHADVRTGFTYHEDGRDKTGLDPAC